MERAEREIEWEVVGGWYLRMGGQHVDGGERREVVHW